MDYHFRDNFLDQAQMKIQFGCGGNRLEGWINHDSDVDIAKPLPYEDNSVDEVFAEHVVEHVDTHQALGFLQEVYRILKPGGAFRWCVPVLDDLKPEHAKDIILGHGHKCAFSALLAHRFLVVAGFDSIARTGGWFTDGHHRVIGKEKDDIETCRLVAIK